MESYAKMGMDGFAHPVYPATFAEAGVPIVVGSDWHTGRTEINHPAVEPGRATITEMKLMRWGGLSRKAIIQAATANAARALDKSDKVGNLEEGKLADLIVVDGNPLEDLSVLENVEVVVQGGKIIKLKTNDRLTNIEKKLYLWEMSKEINDNPRSNFWFK